ncbi:hypothetical protein HAHE_19770 [Haloferula helveola]|uniref:PIN domain-containing protein n=2 Tax=Haloferula helveola TaxID=490095 RepID=A0ABM7RFY5_9BACT|nr:hypothetical protein HAHE_19770 [Haloferula helveola]
MLFAPTSSSGIAIGGIARILGKLTTLLGRLVGEISKSDLEALVHLETPEKHRALRHLIIQYAYLETLVENLEKLTLKDPETEIPSKSFSLITGDQPPFAKGEGTFLDLREEPHQFSFYKERLAVLLTAVCITGTDITSLANAFNDIARSKAISIIKESDQLSRLFLANSIELIEETAIATKSDTTEILNLLKNSNLTGALETNSGRSAAKSPNTDNSAPEISPPLEAKIEQLLKYAVKLDSSVESLKSESSQDLSLQKLEAYFETARDELRKGSLERAVEKFHAILSLTSPDGTEEQRQLRARSISNLGIAALRANNLEEAKSRFLEAYNLHPKQPNIAALYALAFHLDGDSERALQHLQELIDSGEAKEGAYGLYAQILGYHKNETAALEFLASVEYKNEQWFEIKSRMLFQLGKFDEAIRTAEEGLIAFPDSVDLKSSKAVALAAPLTNGQLIRAGLRTKEELDALKEAERIFSGCADDLIGRGSKGESIDVLLNLAAVRLALGEGEPAKEALNLAKSYRPSDERVLDLLVGAKWLSGDLKDAYVEARSFYNLSKSTDSVLKLAAIMIATDRMHQAIDLIDLHLPDEQSDSARFRLLGMKLDALVGSHDRIAAENYASFLEGEFPDSSEILAVIASYHRRRKNWDRCESLYRRAISHATDPTQADHCKVELSNAYYQQRRWTESLEAFPDRPGSDEFRVNIRERAHCNIEIGNLEEAFRLVNLVSRDESDEGILEIRSWIEYKLFRFDEARESLRCLSALDANPRWSMMMAEASSRAGDREAAYGIICDLIDRDPANVEALILASQACYQMAFDQEGFEFAIRAFRSSPDDQRVKGLVSHALLLGPDAVQIDEADLDAVRSSLVQNHAIEQLELPRGDGGQLDLSPILERVKLSSELRRNQIEKYLAISAPLGLFVPTVFPCIWSCWRAMTSSSEGKVFMASGDADAQAQQRRSVDQCDQFVIDYSALMTLEGLGLLDLLLDCQKTVLLPSDTIDLFRQAKEMTIRLKGSSGMLAYNEGHFRFISERPEDIDSEVSRIEGIIEFLEGNSLKPVGLRPAALQGWQENPDLRMWPQAVFLPVGVSLSENSPLFTDQMVLGLVAEKEGGKRAFCTQDFLRSCLASGKLDARKYEDSVIWLIEKNYEFVSIGSGTVLRAFELDSFGIGGTVTKVLARAMNVRNETTARILGEAAARLWKNCDISPEARSELLLEIVQCIGFVAGDYRHGVSFLGGLLPVLAEVPEMAMGLLDTIRNKVPDNPEFQAFMVLLGSIAARTPRQAVARQRNLWLPALPQWDRQNRIQKLVAPQLISLLKERAKPPESAPLRRREARRHKRRRGR